MKYYAFMSITWCFYIIFSFIIIYTQTAQGFHYVVDKTEHVLVNSDVVSIFLSVLKTCTKFLKKNNSSQNFFFQEQKFFFKIINQANFTKKN